MKNYIIKQEGDEWVLYDSEGKKVLGRHKSKEGALAQEKAIQARKGAFEALGITHDDVMLAYGFENDLQTVKDVDVFAIGTWRGVNSPPEGDKYEEGDLNEMVDAFKAGVMKPKLKITHGADREQVDIGEVSNLKVKEGKLFADFVNVPRALYELMKKGLFGKRSAEVLWDMKDKAGKSWRRVLKAVALLAPGQKPAVGDLKEGYQFEAVYCYELPQEFDFKAIIERWFNNPDPKELFTALCREIGGREPTHEELGHAQAVYQQILTEKEEARKKMALEDLMKKYGCTSEEELDAVLADSKKADERLREFEEKQKEKTKTEFDQFVEQAIKDGKVLPKEKEGVMQMFESCGYDDQKIQNLKTFISGVPKKVDLTEKGKKGPDAKEYDQEKPAEGEVMRLAGEFQAEGKAKDFNSALEMVKANHEELWKAYVTQKK